MEITAQDVTKSFGGVTALDGFSLEVPAGVTFGLLGTNGAGKTTFFELLVGLDQPDAGELRVGGMDVQEGGIHLREQIGYLPERVGFPPGLTGREVLGIHTSIRGQAAEDRVWEVLDTVGLSQEAARRRVDGYSNGMRRRLGLAGALLASPAVLVLDEPTAGLDPRGVAEFHRIVERIRERSDATVLLSSHVLSEVDRLCQHVAIMHDGHVLTAGAVDDLVGTGDMTLQLRPADGTSIQQVTATVDNVAAVDPTNRSVRVTCTPAELPSLFAQLDSAAELADVSIESRGLEEVFHQAIPVEENV